MFCCIIAILLILFLWGSSSEICRARRKFTKLAPSYKMQQVYELFAAPILRGSNNFPGGPTTKTYGSNPLPMVIDADFALG